MALITKNSVVQGNPSTAGSAVWLDPVDWLSYENAIKLPTDEQRSMFPDFLVVSPAKTATSWLATNLSLHPRILIPQGKEMRYFDIKWRHSSLEWYCNCFAREPGQLAGDVSPSYALLPDLAIKHIHSIKPELKIILLLRDLPAQAWSHFKHTRNYGEANFAGRAGPVESVSFNDAVRNLVHDYTLSASDYEGIIRRWQRWFPKAQFHIAFFEDAVAEPDRYLAQLFTFLGVDPEAGLELVRAPVNQGDDLAPPAAIVQWMGKIYAERRLSLERYLKKTFDLVPPWPALPTEAARSGPTPLPIPVAGRTVEIDGGLFWDSEERRQTPHGGPAQPSLARPAQFLGDFLRSRDPGNFRAETKLRQHGVSIEDLRLIYELDRLAEIAVAPGMAVAKLTERLAAVERTLEEKDQRIASLDAAVAERDHRLSAVELTLEEKDKRIASLESAIDERHGRLSALEQTLEERSHRITSVETAVEERNSRVSAVERTLEERNQRVLSLEASFEERNGRLAAVEQTLEETDRRYVSLRAAMAERDRRLAGIESALAERDQRLATLEKTLTERDQRLKVLEEVHWRRIWRR